MNRCFNHTQKILEWNDIEKGLPGQEGMVPSSSWKQAGTAGVQGKSRACDSDAKAGAGLWRALCVLPRQRVCTKVSV